MQTRDGVSRIPQDLGAGLFLIALSGIALWQGSDLDAGTLRAIGPGMLPRALAVMTGLCGFAIAGRSALHSAQQEPLGTWSIRGSLFILAAALVFAFTIRPLGFTFAGPAAIVLGALAGREVRWIEILIFALGMTAFCMVLFRLLLGLPIPVAPWLLQY